MLALRLAPYQLRPYNIAYTVCDKDNGSHKALLSLARHIGSTQSDTQTNDRAKEAYYGITDNRCSWALAPFGLPDNSEARNDRQAAQKERDDADVFVARSQPARERDADGTNRAERELQQDAFQSSEAKG